MYLRHTTRGKDGKVHPHWRLVRSSEDNLSWPRETRAALSRGHAQEATQGSLAECLVLVRHPPCQGISADMPAAWKSELCGACPALSPAVSFVAARAGRRRSAVR